MQKKIKVESEKTLKTLLDKQKELKEMKISLIENDENSIVKRLCYSNLAIEFPNLK